MINILRMINKEKNRITEELSKQDDRLDFYHEFFQKNSCSTLKELLACDPLELSVAIIMHNTPGQSLADIKKVVYGNRDIFLNYTEQEIEDLVHMIGGFDSNREVYESVKEKVLTNQDLKFRNIFTEDGKTAILLRCLIEKNKTTPQEFFAFVDMFLDEHTAFIKALSTISIIKQIREEQDARYQFIQTLSVPNSSKGHNRAQDKWVNNSIKRDYNISHLLAPVLAARSEYYALEQERKSRRKDLTKQQNTYDRLESDLYNAITSGEVRNIESLLQKVPSADIRLAILKLVYEHNHAIYAELSETYKQLSANDVSRYRVLLAKYGVSPEIYEVGTVMRNSIEELELMLGLLSKLEITIPREILEIAQNSTLETLKNIQSLVERGIITTGILHTHQDILNPTSPTHENLMRSIDLINQKKLNPYSFSASEEVLVAPHNRMEESIQTLEDYELVTSIKSGMNLSFLTQPGLNEAIDTLLELGYEANLEDNLELLNYKDRFERLKVLKALNIPLTDTASLIEVLSTDKFYVSDSDISKYIYNAAEYYLPQGIVASPEPKKKTSDITKLSEFSSTARTYSFNGVLISKNKVHRNLSHIAATGKQQERLTYGVLKGSTLTDQEVLKVVACLAPQKTAKAVKEKK